MSRTKGRPLAVAVLLLAFASAAGQESLDRALALVAEEHYAQARELLDPFLRRHPDHPQARLLNGVLSARTGRVSEAIEVFKALLADHPGMLEPYNNLAVLYAVQGRLDEARETLLAALEQRPAAVVYQNLGDVYSDLARRAYMRARAFEAGGEAQPRESAGAVASARGTGREGREQAREGGGQALVLRESGGIPSPWAGDGVCASAEGFEDLHAADAAVQWLRDRGAEIVAVRLRVDRGIESYRVFLPPLGSHEEAEDLVREIEEHGVRDVGIIGEGDLKNGISLGVYRDEENVRRRISALEAFGYPAQSVLQAEAVDDYVVDARAPTALDADWEVHFPDHPLRTVDCGDFRTLP